MHYDSWNNAIRAHKGHYFDDKTMKLFNSKLNDVPRRDARGHYYGIVSNKYNIKNARRFYVIVRIDADTGRATKPYDDGEKVSFHDRRRALAFLDNLDPTRYDWR